VSPQSALSRESVWAVARASGVDAEVCFAGVAQLVEHLFCKQVVRGSSPRASSAVQLDRQASGEHARGFRFQVSFGLRSDARVQKYARLRSSLKPCQSAELRGRVESRPRREAAVIVAAVGTNGVSKVSESCPSGQREQAVNLPDLSYAGSNPALSTTPSVNFTDPSRSPAKGMIRGGSCFSGLGLVKPAGVAQLVERQPSKLNVESSSLFSRSGVSASARLDGRSTKLNPLAVRSMRHVGGSERACVKNRWLSGGRISQPGRLAWALAKPSRGPERSVLEYVSTGPETRRSQRPKTAAVLTVAKTYQQPNAHLAQLVEHVLGKDEVTSSILVVGSKQ
jgi:hypothetical protein